MLLSACRACRAKTRKMFLILELCDSATVSRVQDPPSFTPALDFIRQFNKLTKHGDICKTLQYQCTGLVRSRFLYTTVFFYNVSDQVTQ